MQSANVMKILKVASCNSLSGKSKLGYQVGCNAKSEVFIRISSNTGGGWYSCEWVPLDTMLNAIKSATQPLTSFALYGLFKGKSVNTPAFLFAALQSEGLIGIDTDNPRAYVSLPLAPFTERIRQLIAAGTDLKVDEHTVGKSSRKAKPKAVDTAPVTKTAPKTKPKPSKA